MNPKKCQVNAGPIRDACRYFIDRRCCHSLNTDKCPLGLHEVRQELVESVRKRLAAGEYFPITVEGQLAQELAVDKLLASGDLD